MKAVVKRAIRDETGAALALALVLLVVGGLILTPLLGLMSTGLMAGQAYERHTDRLYAADAGVEDAIWNILYSENISYPYHYPEPLTVNDKVVDVEIHREEMPESTQCHKVYRYQILSAATGVNDGDGTAAIDSSTTAIHTVLRVTGLNYSDLTSNAITSGGDVTILGNQGQVVGDISLPVDGVFKPEEYEEEYENGAVKREALSWPGSDEFIDFYKQDVEGAKHYDGDTVIDLNGMDAELKPLYVDGSLTIKNPVNAAADLTLTGTLYISGDLTINPTHDITIYLNGQTIFVQSATFEPPKYAIDIGSGGGTDSKIELVGPGAIIAVGDIYCKPNTPSGVTNPILIMSVRGKVDLQPIGDFYGSIIGKAGVYLNPGNTIVYPVGGFGTLNFPGLIEGKEAYIIESWEIE